MRLWFVGALCVLLMSLSGVLFSHRYGFTYQFSGSMPKGLYFYHPLPQVIARGDVVLFSLPEQWKSYVNQRHWLIKDAWLMKKVEGIPGDFVCLRYPDLKINQQVVAHVLSEYAPSQSLPVLNFCRVLGQDEYMLIGGDSLRSFDSRYFGPLTRQSLIAQAIKVGAHHES